MNSHFLYSGVSIEYDLYVYDVGWLQLVGSIKLQVSFAKETYKTHYILQKRTMILSILLIVATPPYDSIQIRVYSIVIYCIKFW